MHFRCLFSFMYGYFVSFFVVFSLLIRRCGYLFYFLFCFLPVVCHMCLELVITGIILCSLVSIDYYLWYFWRAVGSVVTRLVFVIFCLMVTYESCPKILKWLHCMRCSSRENWKFRISSRSRGSLSSTCSLMKAILSSQFGAFTLFFFPVSVSRYLGTSTPTHMSLCNLKGCDTLFMFAQHVRPIYSIEFRFSKI